MLGLTLIGGLVILLGRAERWIVSAEARLRHLGQLALTCVAGAAGAVLLVLGLSGLLIV
jgi:hypothetical protein